MTVPATDPGSTGKGACLTVRLRRTAEGGRGPEGLWTLTVTFSIIEKPAGAGGGEKGWLQEKRDGSMDGISNVSPIHRLWR